MKPSTLSPPPPRRGASPIPAKETPRRAGRAHVIGFACLALLTALLGLRVADAWQQTERREASLPQIEAMARRDPHDGPLLALLGGRRAEAHDPATADALRHAVVSGEGTEPVWQALAAATAAIGDRPRALADLRLGRKALGTTPTLDDALARAEALGPAPDPIALAQAIAPDGPAPLISAYTRGSSLNGLGVWWGHHFPERSGFATRQEWAHQAPEDAQAQRLWGLALMQNRRIPEAALVLARAVALAPNSPAARLALADALDQDGLREKAGLEYIACLKLRRDWLPALLGLGRNGLDDHMEHAVPAYQRATQIAPESAEAWVGLGRAYFRDSSTYIKALEAFQTAARLAPDRTDFFADYATALRHNSRGAEAEALLRRRLRAAPDDAQCHYLLGSILMNDASTPNNNASTPNGEAAAEAETHEALRLSPRQPLAEAQLGKLLLLRGQAREAVPLLEDAVASNRYDVGLLNVLTRAYRLTGRGQKADAIAAQSAGLFQDQQRTHILQIQEHHDMMNQGIHQQLAQLYGRIGQPDRAKQEQDMMSLVRADPAKVTRDRQFLRASIRQILPNVGP